MSEVAHQRHKPEDEPVAPHCGHNSHTQHKHDLKRKRQSDPHHQRACQNDAKDKPQEDSQRAHKHLHAARLIPCQFVMTVIGFPSVCFPTASATHGLLGRFRPIVRPWRLSYARAGVLDTFRGSSGSCRARRV